MVKDKRTITFPLSQEKKYGRKHSITHFHNLHGCDFLVTNGTVFQFKRLRLTKATARERENITRGSREQRGEDRRRRKYNTRQQAARGGGRKKEEM